MQCLSRNKARVEDELIAKVRRDLGVDELDLSMILECLKLGPLDCEHMKSPIPNMDYENNHVGNKFESHKNKGKRECKEQTVQIKPN